MHGEKYLGIGHTLFVDGLPMEMTWEWLLQIFRGEGEVVDVFVLQRWRQNSIGRFGFVRFKKLEEARNAVRNWNGIIIRGMGLKVSFAIYDKDGRPLNESTPKIVDSNRDAEWRRSNHRETTVEGRSYKDVVVGMKHHKRLDFWEPKHVRRKENIGEDRHVFNLHLKELVMKVRDEFDKSVNMEKKK